MKASIVKAGRSGALEVFDMCGVERSDDGILRYVDRPASLVAMLRATVEGDPVAEALVELGGERLSYQELWDRSARVAGGLRAAGVARGDRVAIRLPNGIAWCLAFFGSQMAGAVVVPVNTRFLAAEIEYVILDSGAAYVFEPDRPLPDADPVAPEELGLADLAAIFYTSGTTGVPKGAMTTHENFLSNTETCRRVMHLERHQTIRNLVSVPLFHVTGCNSQLLLTTEIGGTTIIMPTFEVQAFLSAIVDEQIDVLTSVPAIYWLAICQDNFPEVDVAAVRWVTYGGAPTPPELVARIGDAFPNARLGNGFGLTETSSISTFLPHEYCKTYPHTVGMCAPVVEVDLDDPDADGVGELLLRGPNVVEGYWAKPDATAASLVDGWLHSGDLARVDDDGFVQIVDRMKDMINRGGENVYCVEVENALAEHEGIAEVAVVGVPDKMMGEKVGAIVVLRPKMSTISSDEIVSFARERIAGFKVPQYIVLRAEPLPRNAGGKVLKANLRDQIDWGSGLW